MNALMTEFDISHVSEPAPPKWEGLAELDRALAEDRLTAYKLKKAWADPISRAVTIFVLLVLAGCITFIVIDDLIIGH